MTGEPKIDTRPEGSLLLQAKMYGAWNEVLMIVQHAAIAGHPVSLDAGEHKSMRGLTLQRVEVRP
jgi:hypothetical protein